MQRKVVTILKVRVESQRAHVGLWDILGPQSRYMGTPLGPKYIPYTYMDPLGMLFVRSSAPPFEWSA